MYVRTCEHARNLYVRVHAHVHVYVRVDVLVYAEKGSRGRSGSKHFVLRRRLGRVSSGRNIYGACVDA